MSTAAGLPANVSETLLHEVPRFDVERIFRYFRKKFAVTSSCI